MRRVGRTLCGVVLAVALTACGQYSNGETADPNSADRELIRAAVAFDVKLDPFLKTVQRITANPGSPTEMPPQLTELAAAFRSGAEELADIDFPTRMQATADRLERLMSRTGELLDRYATGMINGDLAEFFEVAPELTKVVEQIPDATADLRRALGLPVAE
jgi:hypothetical protein